MGGLRPSGVWAQNYFAQNVLKFSNKYRNYFPENGHFSKKIFTFYV